MLQVVKVAVSLYYGSRMQCQVLPEKLGRLKIERHLAELNGQQQNLSPDNPPATPRAQGETEARGQAETVSKDTVSAAGSTD